jgi:hypothetical protein
MTLAIFICSADRDSRLLSKSDVPGFAITREDAALLSGYFRNASDVFLLIKPNDGGPPSASFMIREEGLIFSYSPYSQFSLVGSTSVPAVREAVPRTPQAVHEALPLSRPPLRAVQMVQPAARHS